MTVSQTVFTTRMDILAAAQDGNADLLFIRKLGARFVNAAADLEAIAARLTADVRSLTEVASQIRTENDLATIRPFLAAYVQGNRYAAAVVAVVLANLPADPDDDGDSKIVPIKGRD